MRLFIAMIAWAMGSVAFAHPHPKPEPCDCPEVEGDPTPYRSKYLGRMLAFDRSRDRVGGGIGLGLTGVYGWVRVRMTDRALKHIDARLSIAPAIALGDPHGLIASAQPVVMVGADLAFVPNAIVHPVVSLNGGVAVRGLVWTTPYPVITVGGLALIDPPGPFEFRVGLHGGLTGQRRTEDPEVRVAAFGWIPELAFGATW